MKDYAYIRAWGRDIGSFAYYIDAQIEKARKDNAPENAIYFNGEENRWHTVDDIVEEAYNANKKERLQGFVDDYRKRVAS